ncbi:imelysin family protein [Pseudomonas sp. 5P_3.1_Bac2]|uniref:imelysin family protein n=1 Tax=Pseudomonas sp. 5P_3.1_Bac2 TaxID=2971617 RepID=UPI0021C79D28|nr:imelysin family protein [Pseudomonas sp. 5P_3.1_Bac2]MCU1715515.1 imelysin [Pseudomonas sp. 5P_3.1_Bac2]
MNRAPLGLALLSLALTACSPTDSQQQVASNLANGVLLPQYQAWSNADQQLASSGKALCAGEQDLTAARQAFTTAQNAWAAVQPAAFGPLAEGNRAWQIQFWPDKKNLVARQVEALLNKKPQLSAADLDKASVVVQGLTAYEYLLFDAAIDLNNAEQKARYCPLIIAIGDHQQELAADILNTWAEPNGIAAQLKQFPNDRYAEAPEAIAEILRTQVSAIDGLKKKLGTPLGRQSKGLPQPYQAEAWRSKASLATLAASLASAEQIWLGTQYQGIQALLPQDQDALKQRINAAYQDTQQRLSAFKQPLGELVASEEGRKQLNDLYDSLNVLHRLHESELATALGIQLGFNAHDGD